MNQEKITGISLFPRLLVAMLLVVVLISGILITVFYVYSKSAVEKQTREHVQQQFAAIGYRFQARLGGVLVKDLNLLAANPILDDFVMSSELEHEVAARGVERFFVEYLRYSRNYESITFVDALGDEAVKVSQAGRVKSRTNVAGSPLFAELKNGHSGEIAVEGPFRDQRGNVLFTAGVYKTDADIGQFGGVILVNHSLREFLAYLDSVRIFSENPLWVFTPEGEVLKKPVSKGAFLDPRPFMAKKFQKDPAFSMVDGGMLIYQDLYVNSDRPLLRLAVSIPSFLLLRDVQAVLRFFLFVAVLGLLGISSIAYHFAEYLSRPIIELAHAAARLAKGDLSTRVTVQSSGEVQLLIESFNRMSEDLEKTTVSKDYVNEIIASMRDTLIVAASDGTILRINLAAALLLGYAETELVGKPLSLVVVDEPDTEKTTLAATLEDGAISSLEKSYRARDGKMIPMLFSASVMSGSGDQDQGIVCVAQDITARKQAEEALKKHSTELLEINEEIKSFAHIVSHDLRAPLVNIKGFSEELMYSLRELGPLLENHLDVFSAREREQLNEVLQKDIPEAINIIGSSVSRMDNLIGAILKLSRAGRRTLTLEPLSVQDLVGTIVESFAHQLGENNAQVRVAAGLPEVIADKIALEQVFGNLLDNAVKYLEPGQAGVIEVSGELAGDELLFRVRDNGRGMAREEIPRAFEIFRRVGRQDVVGEGMGLAYVKTLVRLLGGRIWCESEPGLGTTFSFTLPQAGPPSGVDSKI